VQTSPRVAITIQVSRGEDPTYVGQVAIFGGTFAERRGGTVRKVLSTGQTPHHQPRHRDEDERPAGLGQSFVVPNLILLFWPIRENVRST
jgi:hypothetical protein